MAVINDTIRGLDPNTRYVVRVRSISKLGVKSEWSEAFEFVTPTDSTVPEAPDNLRVNFETPDLILNWDPPTNNTDGTLVQDLNKYQIILDAGIGSVVYETTSPFFVYSFYQNNQDFASPQPGFSIQIRAIDAIGDASNPLNGTANNIPPLTPLDAPTLQDSFNLVTVLMSAHPDDRDISGFVVEHAQGDNDFAHLETITGDSFTHEVEPGTTNRYRFRSRDVFGQESDPSPESSIDTDPPPNVEDPPETPTGLSGTGGYNEDDGAFIDLEWDPNPDLDLNRYELQYIEDGVGNVPQAKVIAPQDTSYRLTGLEADTTYRLVLYARNHIGLRSDPSNEISVTTDPDTTSPDAPLNAHTTSGVRSIIVRWDSNSEADFKAYELYASQTSGFTPDESNRVFKGISTVFVFSTGQDETWHFRLRAIDQDDNFSDFTAEFSGTSLAVDAGKDIVADNLIASSGLIGGVSISPVELSGGRIRGSEFVVDAAGQIRFQASGSVVWEPGAQGGIELAEEGYVNNSSYREDNTLGFNLDNQGLIINEGFINSRALRIGATLQNVLRHSGFDIDRMVDNGSFTDGTYWAQLSGSADYISTPNGKFLGGGLHITNTAGAEIYQDVAFDDTLSVDQNFAGSVWAKTETSAASVRVKVTDLDNSTTYFSSWVNVDATAFVRITNTWALQSSTNNLRFIIEVDNDVIVDGAMLSLTDTAIDWEPAPLELPFNYIDNAHISDLRVDKLRSGTFRGQEMILEDQNNTDARIANTAGTFQIDQTGASFQNGTISMVGGNGAVFIDDGSLRVVAGTETQFYANDTGVFMGGQDATTASLYVDTTDNKVYVQSPEDTGNTFLMDPGAPTTDGRVLRLNPGTGDEADDTFYLTKQGEAFFYKGIIGLDGNGTGGFHVNAAGDMWVGNALRDSAPFVIFSNGDVTLDASEVTLVGSGSIIRQSNDNWWIRGDGAAYFGGDAQFAGTLDADGKVTTGNGVALGTLNSTWDGLSLDYASDVFMMDGSGRTLLRATDSGGTRVLDFDSDASTPLLIRGNSEFRGTVDSGTITSSDIVSSDIATSTGRPRIELGPGYGSGRLTFYPDLSDGGNAYIHAENGTSNESRAWLLFTGSRLYFRSPDSRVVKFLNSGLDDTWVDIECRSITARGGMSIDNNLNVGGEMDANGKGYFENVSIGGTGSYVYLRAGGSYGGRFAVNGSGRTSRIYALESATTSSSANVYSTTSGTLYRSTSSLKYKSNIEDIDPAYNRVLDLRPVWYRSLSEADPDDWSYWGFLAEEADEIDPRLVHYDSQGKPDGVQYEKITVLLQQKVNEHEIAMADIKQELEDLKKKD